MIQKRDLAGQVAFPSGKVASPDHYHQLRCKVLRRMSSPKVRHHQHQVEQRTSLLPTLPQIIHKSRHRDHQPKMILGLPPQARLRLSQHQTRLGNRFPYRRTASCLLHRYSRVETLSKVAQAWVCSRHLHRHSPSSYRLRPRSWKFRLFWKTSRRALWSHVQIPSRGTPSTVTSHRPRCRLHRTRCHMPTL